MDSAFEGKSFCNIARSNKLFLSGRWSDVSFAVFTDETQQERRIVKAHKLILANASEVFETMFYGSLPEDTSHDILIEDITAEIFTNILEHIYTDVVKVTSIEDIMEFFAAAKQYMLVALAAFCEEYLTKNLNAGNALKIYEFAVFHELTDLKEAAMKLIRFEIIGTPNQTSTPPQKLRILSISVEASPRAEHHGAQMDSAFEEKIFCNLARSNKLFLSGCWSDVSFTLFTDDTKQKRRTVKAHKIILANASEVFETMFYGSLPQDTSRDIIIEDITAEVFTQMLEYIYTNVVKVNSLEDIMNYFAAAKKFMFVAFADYCLEYLTKKLCPKNVLQIYEFAAFHDLTDLTEAAMKLIQHETKQIIGTAAFHNIKLSTLMLIAKQETLGITAIELFKAVELLALKRGAIQKLQRDLSDNTAGLQLSDLGRQFGEIVKQIRFLSMEAGEFQRYVGFSSLLSPAEAFAIHISQFGSFEIDRRYPKNFTRANNKNSPTKRIYFDILHQKSRTAGRIIIEVQSDSSWFHSFLRLFERSKIWFIHRNAESGIHVGQLNTNEFAVNGFYISFKLGLDILRVFNAEITTGMQLFDQINESAQITDCGCL